MLKFDLGAAPTTFSPIPPGKKLLGTQRPPTFLKSPDFPPPVVKKFACLMCGFIFVCLLYLCLCYVQFVMLVLLCSFSPCVVHGVPYNHQVYLLTGLKWHLVICSLVPQRPLKGF